jgi:F0F1-type ATP synthase delta subunit
MTITVISASEKVQSFLCKTEFRRTCVEKNVTDCLPTLNNFLNELERQKNVDVLPDIMEHLQNLQVTVKEYFPLVVEGFQWL